MSLLGMKMTTHVLSTRRVVERDISSTMPSYPLTRIISPILKLWLKMSERLPEKFETASLPARAKKTHPTQAPVMRAPMLTPNTPSMRMSEMIPIRTAMTRLVRGNIFLARALFWRSQRKAWARIRLAISEEIYAPPRIMIMENPLRINSI